MFWFFGPKACGILAPRPGIEPATPALEGEVLTTRPPGKSLYYFNVLSGTAQDWYSLLHGLFLWGVFPRMHFFSELFLSCSVHSFLISM